MLDGPLLLPPLLLAGLLVISGVAKLRAPDEVASAFHQLRLPKVISGPAVRAVFPWAEIVLAVLLVVLPSPWSLLVAVIGVLLMLVYLGIIVRALGFGYPITCGCFGRLGLGEVTRRTAVRNALLVALSLLVLWSATAERSVLGRLVDAAPATWLWIALLALTVAIVVVTFGRDPSPAQGHTTPASPDEHELEDYIRQPIPYGTLVDADDHHTSLHGLITQRAQLLIFLSYGCGPCMRVAPLIPQWGERLDGMVDVRPVFTNGFDEAVAQWPELRSVALRDPELRTAQIFRMGTPSAVLLGADGLMAGGPVAGEEQVTHLVEDVVAQIEEAQAQAHDQGVSAPA